MNNYVKGKSYQLITFNGTDHAFDETSASDNYWQLIGRAGSLVHFADKLNFDNNERVLIQFDIDLEGLGLACHNPVPNALWILKSDLVLA